MEGVEVEEVATELVANLLLSSNVVLLSISNATTYLHRYQDSTLRYDIDIFISVIFKNIDKIYPYSL